RPLQPRRMHLIMADKPSLLFVNQHYYPDFASTGQHLTDLAEHLAAEGYDVSVLCSQGRYLAGTLEVPKREVHRGVTIRRVRATAFGRGTHLGRLIDYASFYLQVLLRVLVGRRYDYVVVLTTPPLLGTLGAVARALRGQRSGPALAAPGLRARAAPRPADRLRELLPPGAAPRPRRPPLRLRRRPHHAAAPRHARRGGARAARSALRHLVDGPPPGRGGGARDAPRGSTRHEAAPPAQRRGLPERRLRGGPRGVHEASDRGEGRPGGAAAHGSGLEPPGRGRAARARRKPAPRGVGAPG